MHTKTGFSGSLFATALLCLAATGVQAQPILVGAESGGQVPIEGTWVFDPGCQVYLDAEDDEYIYGKDIQEFLIFTGDQVEGRVVQYNSGNGTCEGDVILEQGETATVFSGGTQEENTCWGGEIPFRQDSSGPLAEHPMATWLIYWLGEGETETGLFYIDDTGDSWYLWRYTSDGDDGNGDANGGEPLPPPEPPCPFPLTNEEPLIKAGPVSIPVAIDIRPGSYLNPVNPASKGVIPVAVLGSIDFDTAQVDISSVVFGPAAASPVHDGHVADVNADGFMDMVLHFNSDDTGIACGDTTAALNGRTYDDRSFTGTDAVYTVGCR